MRSRVSRVTCGRTHFDGRPKSRRVLLGLTKCVKQTPVLLIQIWRLGQVEEAAEGDYIRECRMFGTRLSGEFDVTRETQSVPLVQRAHIRNRLDCDRNGVGEESVTGGDLVRVSCAYATLAFKRRNGYHSSDANTLR